MLSLHRSIAGASALARRHPRIIGNRPTAATAAANRLASASHHQARATFQPTGRFFLPRLRPPATVEIPIGPSHYPPSPSSQTRSFNRACAPVTGAQTLIRLVQESASPPIPSATLPRAKPGGAACVPTQSGSYPRPIFGKSPATAQIELDKSVLRPLHQAIVVLRRDVRRPTP